MSGSGGNCAWSAMETDQGSKWRQGPNANKRWCDILQLIKLVELTATAYSHGSRALTPAAKAANVARAALLWAELQQNMKEELGSLSKILKLMRKWPPLSSGPMSEWLSTGSWIQPPTMLPSAWQQQHPQDTLPLSSEGLDNTMQQAFGAMVADDDVGVAWILEMGDTALLQHLGDGASLLQPPGDAPPLLTPGEGYYAQALQTSGGGGGAQLLPLAADSGGLVQVQPQAGGPQLQPAARGGATSLLQQPLGRAGSSALPTAAKSHKAKGSDDSKPKKTPNAYMRFCASITLPKGTPDQATIKAKRWKELPAEQKKGWAANEL